ncbi:L-alanine-DL-glutamate epimerase-like enolase superfamily enzyme [Mycobacterium sp. MAA66]|uniref:mandelate racemase/muconate lactonizing enzyme family protein n=1 Tax=Mycobacterium sp. MAA66 TaxID=3156297 RepID=UPI00351276A8
MKISDVRLSILRTELDETVIPTQGAVDKMPELVLVSVSTQEGIDGHYVSYLIPAKAAEHAAEVARTLLVGRDTYDIAALSDEMTNALPPYSNPPALAGADACLWDINAKAAGLPLYKYLGAHRDKIRAYASTVAYPTVDGYLEAIRDAVAQGFTAAKFHPFRDAKRDIELAQAIRREFPDIDLMIDPVCAYTVPEALAVGEVLQELDFYWFENPISDLDLQGLAFLAGKLDVPLAVGEQNFAGFPAMREYLKSGVGFYVRSLAEYAGGVTQMRKSAHACEAFGLNYEIHSYGPTLNLAMYLNVALSVSNCDFAEVMVPQNLLSMGMSDLPVVDHEGYLLAPEKPGLGYDIDLDAVENLTLQRF